MSLRFRYCSLFVLLLAAVAAQPMLAIPDKPDDNDHQKSDVCAERDPAHGHAYGHDKKLRCPARGSSSGISGQTIIAASTTSIGTSMIIVSLSA